MARLAALPRRLSYAVTAMALATGAPLGLLAVRLAGRKEIDLAVLLNEVGGDLPTYLYVLVSTLVVFASFGHVLGRHADALMALSRTDPLTGLGNPLALKERLDQETVRAERYREPLALLLLDVDGLKAINDSHGHRAGDIALQAVARALRGGARQSDLAARIGGDEFALLAPSTSRAAAMILAERIRALVLAEGNGELTVSVGVAAVEEGRAPMPEFLRELADTALYAAKRQGRDRVVAA